MENYANPGTLVANVLNGFDVRRSAKAYNEARGKGLHARVQLHPATDLWMRGARYGEVVKASTTALYVKLDATGKTVRVALKNISEVI